MVRKTDSLSVPMIWKDDEIKIQNDNGDDGAVNGIDDDCEIRYDDDDDCIAFMHGLGIYVWGKKVGISVRMIDCDHIIQESNRRSRLLSSSRSIGDANTHETKSPDAAYMWLKLAALSEELRKLPSCLLV